MAGTLRTDLATVGRLVSPLRRRQLALIGGLLPAVAVAETAMLGVLVPFLALLSGQPASNFFLPWFAPLLETPLFGSPVRTAAMLFIALAIATAILRLALTWLTERIAFGLGHDLTMEVQRRLLHQPYLFHASRHSSELLAALDKVDILAVNLIMQLIQALSAALIGLFIIVALIQIDARSAALAALLVTALYLSALFIVRRRLSRNATIIVASYDQRIRAVQEALGAIRDIILDRSQSACLERFRAIDAEFMRARGESSLLGWAPRFLVETAGLVLIALIALAISGRPGGLTTALPILGALALGAQRLLPLASQLFGGWASLASARPMVSDVAELLRLPSDVPEGPPAPLPFLRSVDFDRAAFRYPARTDHALKDVSLVIPKGARVALVGRTGSGKSTLADLLMGLIEPDEGRISIDGVPLTPDTVPAWQAAIAHVPQAAFLIDASIAQNIALGRASGDVDMERVSQAAVIAQLGPFIETLPDGFETPVGERGVRLSGGQRQRLALARAIYKQAPLLVLDEATSALDQATETAVLRALAELSDQGRTIVIIAHRLSTIEHCDLVYQLEDGMVIRSGSYADVFGDADSLTEDEL